MQDNHEALTVLDMRYEAQHLLPPLPRTFPVPDLPSRIMDEGGSGCFVIMSCSAGLTLNGKSTCGGSGKRSASDHFTSNVRRS